MAHVYVFCVSPIGIRSDNRADKQSEIQLRIGETDCGECGENLGGVGVMDFWETWTFGDLLAEPVRNGIYKKKEFHGRGQKIINMGDLFSYDLISSQEMKRIELNNRELANNLVKDGDLLFARRSFVLEGAGKCSLVVQPSEDTTFESSVIRVRLNPDSANPRFYYYLFRSPQGRALISSIVTGAVVSGIRGSELVLLKVPKPPLPTQHKIAAILSPYDDLIENNTRRIKILEEMAQIIYRQWFIEFQFPGHENVRMVESELGLIPQGWDIKRIDEVAQLHRGKSYRSENLVEDGEGLPFLNLKNIDREGGFRSDGLKWYDGKFKETQVATSNDIIMALTDMTQERRIVARSARVPNLGHEKYVFSMDLLKIKPDELIQIDFLYALLRYSSFAEKLKEYANGTTVLHLSPSHVQSSKLVLPPSEVRQRYAEIAKSLHQQSDLLQKKNINLRQTRDLLLPRLISGELDVSELDIDID
jgi:type I restriction enzyme S subunit